MKNMLSNILGTCWELEGNIVGTHWERRKNENKILPTFEFFHNSFALRYFLLYHTHVGG
jgi:hypothetical protein